MHVQGSPNFKKLETFSSNSANIDAMELELRLKLEKFLQLLVQRYETNRFSSVTAKVALLRIISNVTSIPSFVFETVRNELNVDVVIPFREGPGPAFDLTTALCDIFKSLKPITRKLKDTFDKLLLDCGFTEDDKLSYARKLKIRVFLKKENAAESSQESSDSSDGDRPPQIERVKGSKQYRIKYSAPNGKTAYKYFKWRNGERRQQKEAAFIFLQ